MHLFNFIYQIIFYFIILGLLDQEFIFASPVYRRQQQKSHSYSAKPYDQPAKASTNPFSKGSFIVNGDQTYKIIEKIGSGYFGNVYKGEMPNGKVVAIKVQENPKFPSPQWAYQKGLNSFVGSNQANEVQSLKRVGQLVAGPFNYEGKQVSVLKFLSGNTLEGALSKPMPIKQFNSLHESVTQAIKKMHDVHGLVHGDMHFKNILIENPKSPTRQVHIIDYGVASSITNRGMSQDRKGYSKYIDYLVPETYFLAYAKKHYAKTNPNLVKDLQQSVYNLNELHASVTKNPSLRVTTQNAYYTSHVAGEHQLTAKMVKDYFLPRPSQ